MIASSHSPLRRLLLGTLRLTGLGLVLLALVAPGFAEAGTDLRPLQDPLQNPGAQARRADMGDALAPGEIEETLAVSDEIADECSGLEAPEELVDCGSWVAPTLGDPPLIALLRATVLRVSKDRCLDIVTDIWADERCQIQGRDCGKMLPLALPLPGPQLATGSASGDSQWQLSEIDPASTRRLAHLGHAEPPTSLNIRPPVPPPRA